MLVMSTATYDWADEQYLTMGLDPAQAKFVVVKNPMNFRLGACHAVYFGQMNIADFCLHCHVKVTRSTLTSRKTAFL